MDYDKIIVLDEISHIRTRASMYIGETKSPIHLLQELIDNAVDELSCGANFLKVKIYEDNSFEVTDNGRGFPQGINEKEGIPHAIVAFVKLHSGGKFDRMSYSSSIGLHGVGLTVVNALCDRVLVETTRNKKTLKFELIDAKLNGDWTIEESDKENGTIIRAWPSAKYFQTTKIDISKIREKLQIVKMFSDDAEIVLEHGNSSEKIQKIPITNILGKLETNVYDVRAEDVEKGSQIRVLFGYGPGYERETSGAVNLLPCSRGLHLRIFEKALQNAWIKYLGNDKKNLQPQDFLVGCKCFVSVKLRDVSFSSQTKEYLLGLVEDHKTLVENLEKRLVSWIEDDLPSEILSALIQKFRSYRESVEKSTLEKLIDSTIRLPRDRKKQLGSKLIDCLSKEQKGTELFVCEGDSAGGTFLKIRDPEVHAILPLRGKILNAVSSSLEKTLSNREIKDLVSSLGTGVGDKFDISRLRYEKIIIATDPDIDGAQIRALILGAIANLVPDLIRAGVVYTLQVPLFGVVENGKFVPIFSEEEFSSINSNKRIQKKRMKGLGSFDPSALRVVALDPRTRRLTRVSETGLLEALSIIGYPSQRKNFLMNSGIIGVEN